MIPKKIHYCWFGRNPLPESAQRCIASWRKFLPDYEIIEWNEDNFDVNATPYSAEAYAAGKYAFVSDYARFKILYEHGGVYFDTDVEVIRDFNTILSQAGFMGFEIDPSANKDGVVAPGLGIATLPHSEIYRDIVEYYHKQRFVRSDGEYDLTTVGYHITGILQRYGLRRVSGIQQVGDILVYPKEYLNPLDDNTGILRVTRQTHSIHWYSHSWTDKPRLRKSVSRMLHRLIGTETSSRLRRFFTRSLKNK